MRRMINLALKIINLNSTSLQIRSHHGQLVQAPNNKE
jgi:hypothetical protein